MMPTRSEPAIGQAVLDNGLRTVWEEDHRQPLVALEARILGGLRGEGPYLGSGMTHLLEHMLFKGTTTRAPGSIDQEVRRYGGTINAFTSHDHTGVTLFVESRYLPEALALLSDILQHAVFPPEELAKERPVVISEIRMNLDDPDRRLSHLFWRHRFLVHPYHYPILGELALLDRVTVEDLRTFYHAQYVPNNVVISCVGDVDSARMPERLRAAFGSWPEGAPYQVSVEPEPPAVGVRRAVESLPVQATYAVIGFPSVRLADPDLYPLDVLATILGQGESSRLHETVVRTRRLASVIGAGNYTPFDPGAFTISLRAEPEQADAAIEASLRVAEQVAARGVSPQELQKAKRQVLAEYLSQRQTIDAKAGDLANSLALTGDPEFSWRYVEGIRRVTAVEVKRAARTYLDRTRMTVAMIQPETRLAAAPPAPAATGPMRMEKHVLPNGLTVLIGADRHVPLGSIILAGRGGVRAETEATQGLSNLTAELLTKRTSRKTASQIAAQVESLGGDLEAFSGRDGFGLSLQVLADDIGSGLGLLHELIADSTFPPQELELARQLVLQELKAREDDVFDVGGRLLRRTLFRTHPYRFDPLGQPDTVARVTRKQCQEFAAQWLNPRNMVLTVVGDVKAADVLRQIRRQFGSLPKHQLAGWPETVPQDALHEVRRAVRALPKEQSVVMVGFRGTTLTAADRDALDLLTAVLSGMSGRLFQSVRERYGLSYTLGATSAPGWDPGSFVIYAATKPQERERVLQVVREQLELL